WPLVTSICLSSHSGQPALHPFPTRRSSDLGCQVPFATDSGRSVGTGTSRSVLKTCDQSRFILKIDFFILKMGFNSYFLISFLFKDRKSTRLNSSHVKISYAVFCLKKKNKQD